VSPRPSVEDLAARSRAHDRSERRWNIILGLFTLALLVIILWAWLTGPVQAAPDRAGWAEIDRPPERHYHLPWGILARHRRYERTAERHLPLREGALYLRPWTDGRGAVCGAHQVSIVDVLSPDGARLCALARTPGGAAWEAARQMAESRRWCAARPGECLCPWARINWKDQVRLCATLEGGEG